MTPEQLRGLANTTGMIYDITMCREIFRAHAAALEEIERLNAAWKAQQFHLEAEERESAHWQERAEQAERMAERLKFHAEAMAHYTDCYKDKWPDSGARQTLDEYRAEFKGE